MKTRDAARQIGQRRQRLLAALADHVPDMQARALALDPEGGFPTEDIAFLRQFGALAAPVPTGLGGLGMGTEPEGARDLMEALRLIVRYGTDAQARSAANDALEGHLFGLWVTDPPDAPLRLGTNLCLRGAKAPCSGAGHATRALVTALLPSGESRMLAIRLAPGEHAELSCWDVTGMRATASGRMTLDEICVRPDAVIGGPADYLRQPDFSAGAWRTSAVTLGGMKALIGELRNQLVTRGRDSDPHQRVRVGEALIAQETARLWIARAAQLGKANEGDPQDIANIVNLARIAVEAACLDAIRTVQRALGMAAFRRGGLTELLFRDLSVYLRQPAPDETLTDGAAHFMERDLPALPQWA